MTQLESKIQTINQNQENIYSFLQDFKNLDGLIPEDKIKDWESDHDSCKFSLGSFGKAGLKIIERDAPKTIKLQSDSSTPVELLLWIQLKQVAENETKMKLTLKADLPPMLKMMAKKPLQKALDTIADTLANVEYPDQNPEN